MFRRRKQSIFNILDQNLSSGSKLFPIFLTTYLGSPNVRHTRFGPSGESNLKFAQGSRRESTNVRQKIFRHGTCSRTIIKCSINRYTQLIGGVRTTVEWE